MDLSAVLDGSSGRWTEERHSRFLNLIESTFVVSQMPALHSDAGRFHRCAARLHRRVPDGVAGGDSAEHSRLRSPPTPVVDPDMRQAAIVAGVNTCNYPRKRSFRQYNASLDQVVPEFKSKSYGEDAAKGK